MKRFRTGLAAAALSLGLTGPAFGQFTNWNGSGTDWGTAGSWTNGVPTATTTAQFLPSIPSFGFNSAQPSITGNQTALGLTIGPSPSYGGWTFTGSGELALGGALSTGLTTVGPAAYTFNGPTLAGSGAAALLTMNVTRSSTLTLAGNSVVTANQGAVTVAGGTLRLDNSAVNAVSRLVSGGALTVNGGGVFELIGNAAGTTQNVGNISTANLGGANTFRLTPNGAATVLSFANTANGFSTRPGTRAAYRFEATAGNLGDANGARVTFGTGGVPFLGANGLLASSNGGATVGYAIASDAGGTDFAAWNATDGIVRAGPAGPVANGGLVSDAAGLATQTNTARTFFSPAAGATVTASGTVTTGSIRITPAGAGAVLAMGANTLQTNAIMLDGPETFTLTGTGAIGASAGGTRYVHVNDPQATLRMSQIVASGTNPVVFAGPGTVELTGTALQNMNTDTSRVAIAGGVLRANNTQLNFVGTNSVIALVGGVLEIKNGNNGTGALSDFRRSLGTGAGQVSWGAGAINEVGSGGFSAFGSAASVNLGGGIDPGTVRWNSSSFVATGYALTFGSPQSNAVLTFRNPIQLDAGVAGGYQLREIRVTAGTGGDRTILDGAIVGSESTDLIKTGTGTLELRATGSSSTILGHTLVAGGTLLATNGVSSTGTGNVVVGGLATLGGTGVLTPTGGNAVTVLPGGFLVPGTPGSTDTPGTLTVLGQVNLTSGSTLRVRLNNTTAGSGYGQVAVNGLSLGGATLQLFTGGGFNPASGDRLVVVSNAGVRDSTTFGGLAQDGTGTTTDGGFSYQVSYTGTTAGDLTGGHSVVLYNFAPVPEPAAVLALAAGGLGLLRLRRRLV